MANSKRRCTYCKKYKPVVEGITAPIGFFCDKKCRFDYATKKPVELKKKTVKRINKEFNQKKKQFKDNDRPLRLKAAQHAFNAFVRKRDELLPCISCLENREETATHKGSNFHAGHYKSVGAKPELRFNELNCHKQCAHCNNFLSGNMENYRINLIGRIGEKEVLELEKEHAPKKYTCQELKEIELKYKRKLKEL